MKNPSPGATLALIKKAKPLLLSLFILGHLAALIAWALPLVDRRAALRAVPLADGYVLWVGLWQQWRMFAPRPFDVQMELHAQALAEDGSRHAWDFPRMEAWGAWRRYYRERRRRWGHDHLVHEERGYLWEPAARYAARDLASRGIRAKRIELTRRWTRITTAGGEPSWNSELFFAYDVRPEDLDAPRR